MSSFLTTCYELIKVEEGPGLHVVAEGRETVTPDQLAMFNSVLQEEDSNLSEMIHLSQIIRNDPDLKDPDLLSNLLFYIDQFPATISFMVRTLADRMDSDELVACMLDQLICIDWTEEDKLWKTCLLAIELFSMSGKALEKTTREKEWMLIIPFLANQMNKALEKMPEMIREKGEQEQWNKVLVTLSNCFLDFADFLNLSASNKDVSEFPLYTTDIGSDNGDSKRRYLAYYILCCVYDKVISNLDLNLSDKFYKRFHPEYTVKNPNQKETKTSEQEIRMLKLVYRAIQVSASCGCTFDRLHLIYTSLNQYMKPVPEGLFIQTLNDEVAMVNDRQMINSILYPLSPTGITTLYAISLYAAAVGSGPSEYCLLPTIIENTWIIKKMGVYLVDLLSTSDSARLDKGLFILLYLADDMSDTTLTLDAMDTELKGYTGSGISIPVSRFLEIIATMASSCPDSGVRFYSYQLIQSVLRLSEDEVRVFVLTELLERCPYPSMHTAAIGILKDQIHQAFERYTETKGASVFTSPIIVDKFFTIIFKWKSEWKKDETFWEDYSYIMQALNLYLYLLIRDKSANLTTVLSTKDKITADYIKPIKSRAEDIMKSEKTPVNIMQLEMMLEVIGKINNQQ